MRVCRALIDTPQYTVLAYLHCIDSAISLISAVQRACFAIGGSAHYEEEENRRVATEIPIIPAQRVWSHNSVERKSGGANNSRVRRRRPRSSPLVVYDTNRPAAKLCRVVSRSHIPALLVPSGRAVSVLFHAGRTRTTAYDRQRTHRVTAVHERIGLRRDSWWC